MSADRHHRNSINVRIGDFAPVFWIAARIKRLTLLDHVASWRSPEGGRAYWRTNERNHCWRDRDGESATETEREKERKNRAGRSARGRRGRKRKRHQPRGRERGNEGRSGARKGKEKTGRRTKEGTKYRRRTAVGIKRGDGRRCGGPTLFPVEDWTAAAPLRRPSCPPTSSFLPSNCSFFFFSSSSSSPFRASACACVRARSRSVRARSSRPPISAYLISYFLTYSRSSRSRERERER